MLGGELFVISITLSTLMLSSIALNHFSMASSALTLLSMAGVVLTDEKLRFVVVGDAEENFTHAALTKVFRLLLEGAELIAMERDRYWRSQADF